MNANEISRLIILVADSTIEGRISIETDTMLNGALWRLAHQLSLADEVDRILQNTSMEEMKEAMRGGVV
jgi:hypothetical protein